MGHGGGQVVSVLAFYYDVPSSNPAKVQKIWPILFNEEFFVLKPFRLAMEAHYVYYRKKLCKC